MDSDRHKIVFGIVGAVGAIFFTYLLFYKRFGSKRDDSVNKREKRRISLRAQTHETTSKNDASSEECTLKDLVDEDVNQASFITFSQSVENPDFCKKSDRSSDESSYDVVEADEEEEKPGKAKAMDISMLDDVGEARMVVAEADNSEVEEASFYHSAEETFSKDLDQSLAMPEQEEESLVDEYFTHSYGTDKGSEMKGKTLITKFHEGRSHERSITDSEGTESTARTVVGSGDVLTDLNQSHMYRATANIQFKRDEAEYGAVSPKPKVKTIRAGYLPKDSAHNVEQQSEPVLKSASSSVSDEVTTLSFSASIDYQTEPSSVVIERELKASEITEALNACQNSPMSVSRSQIYMLVILLKKDNPALQPTVLDSLVRVSAFTHNNIYLRGAGCEIILCQQVIDNCNLLLGKGSKDNSLLVSQTKVLTNLSMDPKAMTKLEKCISPLVLVLNLPYLEESVQLSILRPLINLCSVNDFHTHFVPAIQRLYAMLDSGSNNLKLQCAKVLVNLSLNEAMVSPMLSAKAPDCLLDLLENRHNNSDLVLRILTIIGNLRGVIAKLNITQGSLPPQNKAESPKTMFTSLCGVVKSPLLRNKVYRLTRHNEEEIRLQASKLYTLLTMVKQ